MKYTMYGGHERSEGCVAQVHDLTVAYDAKPVLWDIDLNFPQGKLIAIVGPNGAGKTTLIKAMMGLIKPVSGTVGFHLGEGSERDIKKKIAYVPQSGSVDWDFPATALDVVTMGRYGHLGWMRRQGRRVVNCTSLVVVVLLM